MHLSRSLRTWGIAGGILALALGALGLSTLADQSAPASDQLEPASTPGTAAMRVSLDPETGALVPGTAPTTLEKDAELEQMLSRSTEGLVPVYHPDGRVSVHLQGRFMSASVARIDEDGKVKTSCVDDLEQAEAFRQGAPVVQPTSQPEVQ